MLTQLSTVKARLGLEPFDTTDDNLLTGLIRHVSARFATECNRIFEYAQGATYEFRAQQLDIVVDRPPIESVSKFELKTLETEEWIVQPDVFYLFSPGKAVIELQEPLSYEHFPLLGRVTYNGGYVLPGATPLGNQVCLPDDLEHACIEQVAYWYQRRSQLGLVSVSSGDGALLQRFESADLFGPRAGRPEALRTMGDLRHPGLQLC